MQDNLHLDVGKALRDAANIFQSNLPLLAIMSLLTIVIGALSLGFLSAVMFAGALMISLELVRKAQPVPMLGRVFCGFDRFAEFFLFGLLWIVGAGIAIGILMVIPCIGNVLGTLLSVLLPIALFFAFPLMWDRGLSFWDASLISIHFFKANPAPIAIFAFVAWLVSVSGILLCGVGIFFTFPFYPLMMAMAYEQVKDTAAFASVVANVRR